MVVATAKEANNSNNNTPQIDGRFEVKRRRLRYRRATRVYLQRTKRIAANENESPKGDLSISDSNVLDSSRFRFRVPIFVLSPCAAFELGETTMQPNGSRTLHIYVRTEVVDGRRSKLTLSLIRCTRVYKDSHSRHCSRATPSPNAEDWQSAVCPLSSSDSRAQLFYKLHVLLPLAGPRGNDDIIIYISPFLRCVIQNSIFFFTRPYYTYTQVPPPCLSDRKHRRRRPHGLYYYYYYYLIVYKRSSYISPISISYRNRTPRFTLIIVMYYTRAHCILYICNSYNCRGDPRCRPAAICSN